MSSAWSPVPQSPFPSLSPSSSQPVDVEFVCACGRRHGSLITPPENDDECDDETRSLMAPVAHTCAGMTSSTVRVFEEAHLSKAIMKIVLNSKLKYSKPNHARAHQ